MSEDVEEAVAALYQTEPHSFIEARKALAAKLKKEGDKDSATRVAALVKPTPSAWATNRASVTARHAFVSMMKSGVALRSAMSDALRGKEGQQVAALQREQRESIEGVAAEALRLLREAELPSTGVVMGRVRTNLTAIAMTGSWGDEPAACLSKDLPPLDIGALANLLDAAPSSAASSSELEAAVPKKSAVVHAPHAEHAKHAEDEERKRLQAQRIAELEAELREAERARKKSEADTSKLEDALREATASVAELAARAAEAGAEARRLDALARKAHEEETRAKHAASKAEEELAKTTREHDHAARETARKQTHSAALAERLENARRGA